MEISCLVSLTNLTGLTWRVAAQSVAADPKKVWLERAAKCYHLVWAGLRAHALTLELLHFVTIRKQVRQTYRLTERVACGPILLKDGRTVRVYDKKISKERQ